MEYFDKIVQVDLSLNELKKIHTLIRIEIDKSNDITQINDLMRIAKEIEEKTQDYLVWY